MKTSSDTGTTLTISSAEKRILKTLVANKLYTEQLFLAHKGGTLSPYHRESQINLVRDIEELHAKLKA